MQKVITINLNGNAYQLDESGYDRLRAYLDDAERALSGNPDRAEIVADLEQAIADKCQKFLNPHKSVVSAEEVAQIIQDMGPIDAAAGEADTHAGTADGERETATRRLFRIPAGAVIGGVCNGLAAYFAVDVSLVRIGFVITALLTKGAAILGYVLMMFLVPEASTPEERAAAGGMPFNAKAVLERAKQQYAEGSRHWRRHWRQQQRHLRRASWGAAPFAHGPLPPPAMLLPAFALLHLGLLVAMLAALVSLVNTGAILNWHLPDNVPLWAGVFMLLAMYQVVVSPFRAARYWSWRPQAGTQAQWFAFWSTVVWLVGAFFAVWFASNHMDEIREFLQRLPPLAQDFASAMRDAFAR
jgi:phage shock protein PspC (stress-responsive transcriptional regulator)